LKSAGRLVHWPHQRRPLQCHRVIAATGAARAVQLWHWCCRRVAL